MPVSFVFTTDDVNGDFEMDFGDGEISSDFTTDGVSTITFTHSYGSLGTFQPELSLGGTVILSAGDIPEVVVTRVANQDGTIIVGGTDNGDRIILSLASRGGINIRINNIAQPPQDGFRVIVFGNGGNDIVTMTRLPMGVEFFGGEGNDYLAGGGFADTLDGGVGRDRLSGAGGDDVLLGGAGGDTLSGGGGNDALWGDGMIDTVGGNTLPDGGISVPGDIINAEIGGNDRLSGDAGVDTLNGGGGNDLLYGGTGQDYLYGDEGADMLDGGSGNDFLYGGIGADALYGRAGRDAIIGGDGLDRHLGGTSGDLLFAGIIDEFAARDEFSLQTLFAAISSGDSDSAFDTLEFEFGALDDGFAEFLNGETDGDWYLMFLSTGDRFQLTSERNAPNKFRELF
jgi:Ca2+-binding RTX toxin-like protein